TSTCRTWRRSRSSWISARPSCRDASPVWRLAANRVRDSVRRRQCSTGGSAIRGGGGGARVAGGFAPGHPGACTRRVRGGAGRRGRRGLIGAWLRGGRLARRRIQWFWSRGRHVRPLLSGEDLMALGVARGPRVGQCLASLRQLRLDRRVTTRNQERTFVKAWT